MFAESDERLCAVSKECHPQNQFKHKTNYINQLYIHHSLLLFRETSQLELQHIFSYSSVYDQIYISSKLHINIYIYNYLVMIKYVHLYTCIRPLRMCFYICGFSSYFFLFCTFKGDLSCKNHFYKVFEHRFVASVCENNQLVMVKMHQLII